MQCTATSKQSGERCKKPPRRGATVCHFHGGSAPQVQAKAAVNIAEQDLRRWWAAKDHPAVEDPLRELQLLTGELLAWKELLRNRIGELSTLGYRGMTSEQVRAEVQLYRDAVTQLGSLLVSIGRLKIDERLITIEEQRADLLAAAVEAAVAEVGLTGPDARRARLAVVRHLRPVKDGEAA